jgi:AraC-like DNA-binding protein
VRDQWLVDAEERKALAEPLTRRLLVDGVGHYLDRHHGHDAFVPHGARYTSVFVCVRGTGWVQVGSTRRRVSAGSALLIPAGLPHSYGPSELPWSIWWCTLVGSDAAELLRSAGATAANPVIRLGDVPRFVSIIDEIATIYEHSSSPAQILEAAGTAWKLMTRLSADRSTWRQSDPLERAIGYLTEHVAQHVRIPDLADRVGLSQSRLNELFRAATGRGVLAYQIELRMAKARRLLEETDASVSEVAREVGYTDPYYFSRHFSRANGASPSRFRELRAEPA